MAGALLPIRLYSQEVNLILIKTIYGGSRTHAGIPSGQVPSFEIMRGITFQHQLSTIGSIALEKIHSRLFRVLRIQVHDRVECVAVQHRAVLRIQGL